MTHASSLFSHHPCEIHYFRICIAIMKTMETNGALFLMYFIEHCKRWNVNRCREIQLISPNCFFKYTHCLHKNG